MIEVTNLAHLHRAQAEELEAAALRVLRSGAYLRGAEVEAFEREFARCCRTRGAVAVGSGLDALKLAFEALGIGPGDEVIVPGHTAIATWLAITHSGAAIVPVDVDRTTMLLDPDAVRAVIGPRTSAIVLVHLYGLVAEVDEMAALARAHGIALIEDGAQAHGARAGDRVVGSIGDIGAFSLYPTKNLGAAGDGGIVISDDAALLGRVRMLGNYGERRRSFSELLGHNSRLDEVQAAMLRIKLRRLEHFNEERRRRAEGYIRALSDVPGIELPVVREGTTPVWHQFVVRVDGRDAVRATLEEHGVRTLVHYPEPPHRSRAYADLVDACLPVTDRLSERVLSIPSGPHVDDAGARRVSDELVRAVEQTASLARR